MKSALQTPAANESAKELLHELYGDWYVRTSDTSWERFVSDNYEKCQGIVKIAVAGFQQYSRNEFIILASTEAGVLQCLAQLDLMAGASRNCERRLKMVMTARKHEQEVAAASYSVGKLFVDKETRQNLAEVVDTNVSTLVHQLRRLKAKFDKLIVQEDRLDEQVETYLDLATNGYADSEELSEINAKLDEFDIYLRRINTTRGRLIAQQTELTEQLSSTITSLSELNDICIQIGLQTYDYAQPLGDPDNPSILARDSEHIHQQMGVAPDERTKAKQIAAVVRSLDAQAEQRDQADVIEGLAERVAALKAAVNQADDPADFEYEEIEFEPLEPDATIEATVVETE